MTIPTLFWMAGLICLLVLPAVEAAERQAASQALDPKLPNVLLIGDSICGGYCRQVMHELQGKAKVVKNAGNGADTENGLKRIEEWLGATKWDVIHFNWGLHDLKRGGTQVPLDRYSADLETLVTRLERTGAKLILATTTPVPEKNAEDRRESDVLAYNAAAVKIAERHHVVVNDLHALALPNQQAWQIPDNVHFKDSTGLGRAVAAQIAAALDAVKPAPAAAGQ